MTAKANGERGQERVCHLGQTELIPPSKDEGGAPVKPTAGTTPAGRALDYELIPPSENEGGAPANHRNTNCKTTRTTN